MKYQIRIDLETEGVVPQYVMDNVTAACAVQLELLEDNGHHYTVESSSWSGEAYSIYVGEGVEYEVRNHADRTDVRITKKRDTVELTRQKGEEHWEFAGEHCWPEVASMFEPDVFTRLADKIFAQISNGKYDAGNILLDKERT